MHAAFADPAFPGGPGRGSVEVRMFALFESQTASLP